MAFFNQVTTNAPQLLQMAITPSTAAPVVETDMHCKDDRQGPVSFGFINGAAIDVTVWAYSSKAANWFKLQTFTAAAAQTLQTVLVPIGASLFFQVSGAPTSFFAGGVLMPNGAPPQANSI